MIQCDSSYSLFSIVMNFKYRSENLNLLNIHIDVSYWKIFCLSWNPELTLNSMLEIFFVFLKEGRNLRDQLNLSNDFPPSYQFFIYFQIKQEKIRIFCSWSQFCHTLFQTARPVRRPFAQPKGYIQSESGHSQGGVKG